MEDIGYRVETLDAAKLQSIEMFMGTFSIFKCVKGVATIEKDEKEYLFESGQHIVIFEATPLRFCRWSDDIEVVQCEIGSPLAYELEPYMSNKVWLALYSNNPSICSRAELKMLDEVFAHLLILHSIDNMEMRGHLVRNTIVNYSLILYNIILLHSDPKDIVEDISSSHTSTIIDRFFYLCSQYHTKERKVAFYVDKLNISQRHLYNLTLSSLKLTPKQVLDSYIIGTIKKLLLTTTLSIQQIAETLEFADQSTLRQFFFRGVGISPREYRRKNR